MTNRVPLETLLGSVLEVDPKLLSDATKQTDTQSWTSMRHLELVVSLEEAYGVSFATEEIVSMTSVGRIRTILADKGVRV